MTLTLPDTVENFRLTPDEIRVELACALYSRGLIGRVGATELAGVDFFAFQHALGERGIPIVTEQMLEDDLASLKALFPLVIVVADTSVLLNLCRIGQVELLARLFHEVVIPLEVAAEFDRLARQAARFQGLTLPAWVRQQQASTISAAIRAAHLDPGETAALALALEIHADALLVDERRGHQVAVQLGIKTIGVLGILLQAKTSGFVPQLRPMLDALERDAQFWIAPLVRQRVLQLAGE